MSRLICTGLLFGRTEKCGWMRGDAMQSMVTGSEVEAGLRSKGWLMDFEHCRQRRPGDGSRPTSLIVIYSYGTSRGDQRSHVGRKGSPPMGIARRKLRTAYKSLLLFEPFGNLDTARQLL